MCWSTGEGDKGVGVVFFGVVAGMCRAVLKKAFSATSASLWASTKRWSESALFCSRSTETNPFPCRSSASCTMPAKSAVAPAPSPRICASVNGFCVAVGAEQSEFRLLHSSRYWPTLSLIILANIDTACVVSHLYPLPLPCLAEWEKNGREKEGRKNWWKGGKESDKEMYLHSLRCASLWCNYKGNCLKVCCNALFSWLWREHCVYSGGGVASPMPPQLLRDQNAPCQLEFLIHEQPGSTNSAKRQSFQGCNSWKQKNSHNFKAQSHTLIWILKLSRCPGASNSSFCKTIIMTNVCISSLPNPLSVSLAWGNAAEKLTQICYMWLPIGNGLKLGKRMVWCKIKSPNFRSGQKRPSYLL